MRIEVVGRNLAITPSLRKHVRERLEHVVGSAETVTSAHVVLSVEKRMKVAEIILRRRGGSLAGEASGPDMYGSIVKAVERIETQIRRKEKRSITRKRRGARPAAEDLAMRTNSDREIETGPSADGDAAVIVEERIDRVKPIGVEEAILLLERTRRPFVVFRNVASGGVAVVYQRRDGRFGLIDPPA